MSLAMDDIGNYEKKLINETGKGKWASVGVVEKVSVFKACFTLAASRWKFDLKLFLWINCSNEKVVVYNWN